MKKILILLSIIICNLELAMSQTKPTTTTKKTTSTVKKTTSTANTPVKKTTTSTSSTVKKTSTNNNTIAPQTNTTTQKAAETTSEQAPQAPASQTPPKTGAVTGPKSYDDNTTKPAEKASPAKTTKTTTVAKTEKPAKAAKEPKVKEPKVKSSSASGKQSYFGLRGGYNLASLAKVDELLGGLGFDTKNQPGYMGGLFVNLALSKAVSIQPEVLYSQQGYKAVNGANYYAAKLTHINVPLLLKVAVGTPSLKFFINAGPYIGYRLKQATEIMESGNKTTADIDFVTEYDGDGVKDNRIDFGGIGGAGFQIGLGRAALTLEGRYLYGMADPQLYKNGKPAEIGIMGHQRVMTGSIGLLFPIGGK